MGTAGGDCLDMQGIRRRIEYLTERLNRLDYHYFIKNESLIDKDAYNAEKQELLELVEKYKDIIDIPILNYDKEYSPPSLLETILETENIYEEVYSYGSLAEFCEDLRVSAGVDRLVLSVEKMVKGLDIKIEYIYGNLHKALLRGEDGQVYDITRGIRSVTDVPKYVPQIKRISSFIVLGYATLKLEEIDLSESINEQLIRILRDEIKDSYKVRIIANNMENGSYWHINSQQKIIKKLGTLGFNTLKDTSNILDIEDIEEFIQKLNRTDYAIHGILVKVDNLKLQKELKSQGKPVGVVYRFK